MKRNEKARATLERHAALAGALLDRLDVFQIACMPDEQGAVLADVARLLTAVANAARTPTT